MSEPNLKQLLLLGAAWSAWAGLHSLLLWEPLRGRIEKALGWTGSFYRACYSGLALLSILPICWWTFRLGGIAPFFWTWPWLLLQAALWAAALAFIWWAWWSFRNNGVDLMGWEDAALHHHEPPHLVQSGAYAWSRHPMYLASVVLLWSRSLVAADLTTNLVLTVYLGLGAWHEEHRMARAFGQRWREYADKVWHIGPRPFGG